MQEKVEEDGGDEEKEKVIVQVEAERLPRVPKPYGDVFEDLMKLDIGECNVDCIQTLDYNVIDKHMQDCLYQVNIWSKSKVKKDNIIK